MRIAIEALVGDDVFLELDIRESTPVVGFPSHDVPDRIPAQSRIVPGRLLCLDEHSLLASDDDDIDAMIAGVRCEQHHPMPLFGP